MGNQQSACGCVNINEKSQLKESAIIQVYKSTLFVKGSLNLTKPSTFMKMEIAASQFCASTGIGINYVPLIMRLMAFKQDDIFQAFSTLPELNRTEFMDKIDDIFLNLMDSLYEFLILNQDRKRVIRQLSKTKLAPFQGLYKEGIKMEDRLDLISKGLTLLRSSKVAIVFMCGGASSRFFFQDKFLQPLDIYDEQTTILKMLLKKLRQNYRSKAYQQIISLPIIILGNQTNTSQIQDYMRQNNFFNFKRSNVFFSDIPSLPILNQHGKICLNFEYNHLRRPKGSACYLEQILHPVSQQILLEKKIEYLHFVGTQNLAQSPGDPLFLGMTHMLKRKVAIKCTEPEQPYQNFDRIISSKKGIRVLDTKSLEIINEPSLFQSNIAMNSMIFSVESLRQTVQNFNKGLQLEGLYRQMQIAEHYYDFGMKKPLVNQKCWAFQKDIKDVLSYAHMPLVFKVDRKEFIPLITSKSQYSVAEACQNYKKYHPLKKQVFQIQQNLHLSNLSYTTDRDQILLQSRVKRA